MNVYNVYIVKKWFLWFALVAHKREPEFMSYFSNKLYEDIGSDPNIVYFGVSFTKKGILKKAVKRW